MAEIKWSNIDGSNMNTATDLLARRNDTMYARTGDLVQGMQSHLSNMQQGIKDQYEFEKEQNTQKILNQIAGTESQEDINRLMAQGITDASKLLSQYDTRIDLSKINQAKASWVSDTQNRAAAKDTLKDTTPAAQKIQAQVNRLVTEGKTKEALDFLAQNRSALSNTSFSSLMTTLNSRLDADREFILKQQLNEAQVEQARASANANNAQANATNIQSSTNIHAARLQHAKGMANAKNAVDGATNKIEANANSQLTSFQNLTKYALETNKTVIDNPANKIDVEFLDQALATADLQTPEGVKKFYDMFKSSTEEGKKLRNAINLVDPNFTARLENFGQNYTKALTEMQKAQKELKVYENNPFQERIIVSGSSSSSGSNASGSNGTDDGTGTTEVDSKTTTNKNVEVNVNGINNKGNSTVTERTKHETTVKKTGEAKSTQEQLKQGKTPTNQKVPQQTQGQAKQGVYNVDAKGNVTQVFDPTNPTKQTEEQAKQAQAQLAQQQQQAQANTQAQTEQPANTNTQPQAQPQTPVDPTKTEVDKAKAELQGNTQPTEPSKTENTQDSSTTTAEPETIETEEPVNESKPEPYEAITTEDKKILGLSTSEQETAVLSEALRERDRIKGNTDDEVESSKAMNEVFYRAYRENKISRSTLNEAVKDNNARIAKIEAENATLDNTTEKGKQNASQKLDEAIKREAIISQDSSYTISEENATEMEDIINTSFGKKGLFNSETAIKQLQSSIARKAEQATTPKDREDLQRQSLIGEDLIRWVEKNGDKVSKAKADKQSIYKAYLHDTIGSKVAAFYKQNYVNEITKGYKHQEGMESVVGSGYIDQIAKLVEEGKISAIPQENGEVDIRVNDLIGKDTFLGYDTKETQTEFSQKRVFNALMSTDTYRNMNLNNWGSDTKTIETIQALVKASEKNPVLGNLLMEKVVPHLETLNKQGSAKDAELSNQQDSARKQLSKSLADLVTLNKTVSPASMAVDIDNISKAQTKRKELTSDQGLALLNQKLQIAKKSNPNVTVEQLIQKDVLKADPNATVQDIIRNDKQLADYKQNVDKDYHSLERRLNFGFFEENGYLEKESKLPNPVLYDGTASKEALQAKIDLQKTYFSEKHKEKASDEIKLINQEIDRLTGIDERFFTEDQRKELAKMLEQAKQYKKLLGKVATGQTFDLNQYKQR